MKNRFTSKGDSSTLELILIYVSSIVIVWLVGSSITAGLILGEMIPTKAMGYGVLITLYMSGLIAAKIAMKQKKVNKVFLTAGSAVVVIVMLLLGNFILGAEGVEGFAPTLAVVAVSSVCAMFRKPGTRKKKYRNNFRK